MYSNIYNDAFLKARMLIENKEFKSAYDFLQTIATNIKTKATT